MWKYIKENWFVAVVALFFVAVSIFFAYDQNKGKLPGKTVDGKQVVFSLDDYYFTADDYYDELKGTYFNNDVIRVFQNALLDEAYKTTDDFKDEVRDQVSSTVSYYQAYYGYGEEYLDYIAKYYYGYDSFYDYVFYSLKSNYVYEEYIDSHLDELFTAEFAEKNQPRIVRYVVIAMNDPANPTEDETSKLEEAKKAWASEEYSASNFADFAKKYSQDSGASTGGLFGYLDKNTSGIDEVFLNTALATADGQVSDWTYSEKFGYYLIYVESTKVEDFKGTDGFYNAILSSDTNIASKILWAKAQELGVTFGDEETEKLITDYYTKVEEPSESESDK